MEKAANRRPLKSRSTQWAHVLTRCLLKTPITPNMISLLGIAFAGIGAAAFVLTAHSRWFWLAAALCIQLRLLANLLDGLVAIEGGRHSPTGALFNEFPDRIEDSLLLIAAGYAAGHPELGWGGAVLAMGTAYLRALGSSLGLPPDFRGPMAKPQRMALLTLAAVAMAALPTLPIMTAALTLICMGAVLTCARRLQGQITLLKGSVR